MGKINQIQVGSSTYDIEDAGAQPKIPGKGLSTNDYTSDERDKLASIARGAQANVIEHVKVNGIIVTPSGTTVDITTPTKTSELSNDSAFITKSVNDLVNYYLKAEIYTKGEVQSLIAAIKQFVYELVAQLPAASAATTHKIYLVPAEDAQQQNIKDEYVTILVDGAYVWEQIGSTAIDLSNYYNKQQTDAQISTALSSALVAYTTTESLILQLSAYRTASAQDAIDAGKANKVSGATAGHLAALDSDGNLEDSEMEATDIVAKGGDEMAALAIIINHQNARIEALENALRFGLKTLVVDNLEVRNKFNQFVSEGNSYLRGAGAPSAAVTPENWNEDEYGPWTGVPQYIGQRYLNTSTDKWYTAKGNAAVSDWVQDTNA